MKAMDEFDILVEHIASQLRNLQNKLNQLMALHRIHNILYEIEMGSVQESSAQYPHLNISFYMYNCYCLSEFI